MLSADLGRSCANFFGLTELMTKFKNRNDDRNPNSEQKSKYLIRICKGTSLSDT